MRGIILAVCSKNDPANALKPFSDNPQMVLRRNDIAVFIANWENKADNIRTIRERLNIGYDAMVFLDDNLFERELVRQLLPEVIVPELPEDPADYVRFLSSLNLFETTSYSAEDSRRADQYKEEADRLELRASMSDIGEYLRSLDMRIRVGRFDPPSLPRITQLIQRSNQFNLTTRRLNEEACRRLMLDEEKCMPLCAILSDRCGDQGLISIVILQFSGKVMTISDWLMSCRVLARGVEEYLMNYVIDIALRKNIRRINAMYIPTAKNSMVKGFFARFGFLQVCAPNGAVHWTLDPVSYQPAATVIREG
jgi:FkbH-like protein